MIIRILRGRYDLIVKIFVIFAYFVVEKSYSMSLEQAVQQGKGTGRSLLSASVRENITTQSAKGTK